MILVYIALIILFIYLKLYVLIFTVNFSYFFITVSLVSPYYAQDPSVFPTTLIVSPEYDYLRRQAENFAHMLSDSGVDVVIYRYQGMGHAFFEHTGEFPQAEDCINEIAAAIMAL